MLIISAESSPRVPGTPIQFQGSFILRVYPGYCSRSPQWNDAALFCFSW